MKTQQLPPGNFGLPFIGETVSFLRDPNFSQKRQQKYGSIFKSRILGRPTVFMIGPEANQFILSSHFDHFSWRDGWPPNFKELLGNSLFVQEGEEHRKNRKLLAPAFHSAALANYFQTMETIIHRYFQKWEQQETLTWFPQMKQMTFEIAGQLLLGSESGEMTDTLAEWFSQLTAGLFAVPFRWSWTTYGKALQAKEKLLAHIETAICYRQQHPANDALGLLVQSQDEEGNTLSLEEIKYQALLLLFAGHETTTSMLTSLCIALAQHPEILAKARVEQEQFGNQLTLEQLKQMSYLDQILLEVERLFPPVRGGFRGVVKSFEFQGYHVPEGWLALYQIHRTHQDQSVYSEPEQFKPERFNPDNPDYKKVDFSLVGFGGGPRICIGYAFAKMEMKLFAAYLLRHYDWEILPNQDLTLDPIPTLHPRDGFKVKLKKRV